jgi:hypothetical protein
VRELGFKDARVTPAAGDGGADVVATGLVAQVKLHGKAVGRPDVQRLRGTAHNARHALFYSFSGYTGAAIAFANEANISLFDVVNGSPQPVSKPAQNLVREARRNSEAALAARAAAARAKAEARRRAEERRRQKAAQQAQRRAEVEAKRLAQQEAMAQRKRERAERKAARAAVRRVAREAQRARARAQAERTGSSPAAFTSGAVTTMADVFRRTRRMKRSPARAWCVRAYVCGLLGIAIPVIAGSAGALLSAREARRAGGVAGISVAVVLAVAGLGLSGMVVGALVVTAGHGFTDGEASAVESFFSLGIGILFAALGAVLWRRWSHDT